jgi:hypothetical protein
MFAAATRAPLLRARSIAVALLVCAPLYPGDLATAFAQSTGGCRRNGGSAENWHEQNDGEMVRWRAHWSGTGCSIDIRSAGEIRFNDDFTDISSIARSGWLEITEMRNGLTRRVTIRNDALGRLSRTWSVNGRDLPWDDAARGWLADLLIELDRHTATGVEYRYPKLFAQGGVAAVIDETEKMESDYAQGVYLRKLIDRAKLTDDEFERVVSVATRDMNSDYEMARILMSVADQASLNDDGMRRAYLRGVERMSSDYERSRVLQVVVARSSNSPEVGSAAIKAAGSFHSDYERSRVLLAAIGNKSLGAGDVIPILETVTRSSSDYEKARVMLAVAERWKLTGDARKAYLRAADTIRSDYENRRVLAALVNQ